jgi:hypothetical protein
MTVRKKSRRQSAKAQDNFSSKDARSQGSAKRKSKKSKSEIEKLRVATPTNSGLAFLAKEGLVVPDDLDPSEEFVELDLTGVPNGRVGASHSRWAVRHAHALYVLAVTQTKVKRLQRRIRVEKAKYRITHKGGKKFELDDEMALNPKIKKLEDKLVELETHAEIMEALMKGFEDYRNAASREMSRRDSERAQRS